MIMMVIMQGFMNVKKAKDIVEETILHEIQHAIQNIEGFALGASGLDKNYMRTAGEVEGRSVQRRADMDMSERMSTLLAETEDVAREDQIILRDGMESYEQSMWHAGQRELEGGRFKIEYATGERGESYGHGIYLSELPEIGQIHTQGKGYLYTVEGPENDMLLNWDERSAFIRELPQIKQSVSRISSTSRLLSARFFVAFISLYTQTSGRTC